MWYGPQVFIDEYGSRDDIRMVTQYDPLREFVTVLLKEYGKVSSYRVGFLPSKAVTWLRRWTHANSRLL